MGRHPISNEQDTQESSSNISSEIIDFQIYKLNPHD
jgi:hypothetical protein